MANTIETQVLVNGSRNLVLHIHIDGDGTGDEAATLLVDASAYNTSDIKIMSIDSQLVGFTAELIWDATANVHAWELPDYDARTCFKEAGGLINNAGAGKTGDILITTTGLGAGDTGHFMLYLKKRNNV